MHNIIRRGQGLVGSVSWQWDTRPPASWPDIWLMTVWLSQISGHDAGGLVSQWDSTIESKFTMSVQSPVGNYLRCWQDIKLQQPQYYVGIVVVLTDLWGKEPHKQVGVGRVMASGSLGGVMVSTLTWNARDVRFDSPFIPQSHQTGCDWGIFSLRSSERAENRMLPDNFEQG